MIIIIIFISKRINYTFSLILPCTYVHCLETGFICFSALDITYLGNALKGNPGYLKLRRIRAAQMISNTVRAVNFIIKVVFLFFSHRWYVVIAFAHHFAVQLAKNEEFPFVPCLVLNMVVY